MSDNRFESPTAELNDGQADNMRYAGFWIRAVASIIDSIWQIILVGGLLYAVLGANLVTDPNAGGMTALLIQTLLPAIIIIAFWVYFGATPGKMLFGLKIRNVDGSEIGAGKSIGRYLGYFISMIPLGLGFLWVAFDKRKQGWHDKLAKTVVVKAR